MLALGLFVGFIISTGVIKTTDWTKLQGLFVTIIGSALSGGAFAFIEKLGGERLGDALFFYPIGLLLGLMWRYALAAITHIKSPDRPLQVVGWLHIIGMTLVTLFTALLLFTPSLRKLLPE